MVANEGLTERMLGLSIGGDDSDGFIEQEPLHPHCLPPPSVNAVNAALIHFLLQFMTLGNNSELLAGLLVDLNVTARLPSVWKSKAR